MVSSSNLAVACRSLSVLKVVSVFGTIPAVVIGCSKGGGKVCARDAPGNGPSDKLVFETHISLQMGCSLLSTFVTDDEISASWLERSEDRVDIFLGGVVDGEAPSSTPKWFAA